MAGLKEFKEKIQSDSKFAEKVKSLESFDELLEFAESNGYEFSEKDIEDLTSVSGDDVAKVAGGLGGFRDIPINSMIGLVAMNKYIF